MYFTVFLKLKENKFLRLSKRNGERFMNNFDTDILLETGTNELEILEFVIENDRFGINVAKIRELIQYQPIQKLPHSQRSVEGIMRSRDEVLTVVDLANYLNYPPSPDTGHDILIIASFNQINVAFHVHRVEGILRISWQSIEKPNAAIYGRDEGIITGIVKLDNRMIALIDFEKIICDINPSSSIEAHASGIRENRDKSMRPILIAEDSALLSKMIVDALQKAGYMNIIHKANGLEAWDYLETLKTRPGPIEDHLACIITDIEMPQMDGHHLTKRVKSDPVLAILPVVIFSSLITETMMLKGKEVGADAQLSKPEIGGLINIIDDLILP